MTEANKDNLKNVVIHGHDGTTYRIANIDSDGHQYSKGYVKDPDTLSWVAATQSVLKTDTLTVNASLSSTNLATALYADGSSTYICKAAIGSELDDAVWQISLLDEGANPVQILWCDGNELFDNTATDLATVQGHSYL